MILRTLIALGNSIGLIIALALALAMTCFGRLNRRFSRSKLQHILARKLLGLFAWSRTYETVFVEKLVIRG